MKGDSPAIRVADVSKIYKMYDNPGDLLLEALSGRKRHHERRVLHGINFDVPPGEVVGIIGQNGAGKSTLLKIIAGTLKPSTGSVQVDGRVAAILELGTGFNPNYTGRDNVIVSGMLRGMSEAEVRAKLDSIIAFSGLEKVINEPFHTYSSGMQARLAFATAVSVDADVIIIDEALAAGDVRFAARSLRRIKEISQSGVTCLFVSHVTYQIMQLCSRAIWIDKGCVRMDGPAIDVVREYEYEMHDLIASDGDDPLVTPDRLQGSLRTAVGSSQCKQQSQNLACFNVENNADETPTRIENNYGCAAQPALAPQVTSETGHSESHNPNHYSTGIYRISRVHFLDGLGRETRIFRFGGVFCLQVAYERLLEAPAETSCGLAVAFNRTSDFEAVMYFNTVYPHSDKELVEYDSMPYRQFKGRQGVIEARIEPLQLTAGEYYVSLGILPNAATSYQFYEYMHCHFRITILSNGFNEPSVFYPIVSWSNGPVGQEVRSMGV